ncbi:UDP-Glycosyltransferase/glycogen phosphorylase [Mycena crocata]|nr:UDP-Glycosyltransferase/glycogen phosphorylase [Mycena crocata]
MAGPNTRHIVLVPIPAYGHIRPICAFICRAVASRNVVVTLLLAPNWLEKARADIDSQLPGDSEALDRIRIVSLFESPDTDLFALMALTVERYPFAYNTLFRGDAIRCATTGTTFAAMPSPTVIIMDIFAIEQLRATRAISGTSIPIFMLVSGNAGALLRVWGPEVMGGLGDFWVSLDVEAARTGKTTLELGEERLKRTDGKVFKVPGKPPMFDYEVCPQDLQVDGPPMTPWNLAGYAMILECDGIFLGTTGAYDGESLAACEEWITQTLRKPMYTVGPLLPPGYGIGSTLAIPPKHAELKTFLDSMGSKYGKDSVLFISFGSVFWPARPEQLEDLIDALTEKKFPFILCHGSPFATVPDALMDKIKTSGLGIATKWCPQQLILNHPTTGWFLTHGGHGGITESLASGVPMICWPFDADQPIAAEHLSQTLKVAFHLIEVRTGSKGLQPMHNGRVPKGTREALRSEIRDVIDQCRGAVGAEMRENARRIQGELAEAWAEGGSSELAMREFFARYLQLS